MLSGCDGGYEMRVLVIQNDALGPPGLIGNRILANGGNLDIVMPPAGTMPANGANHDGLLVLGGPMSAADDAGYPHYKPLLSLIRDFAARDKPVLGVCLGSQLIARAFGGVVTRHDVIEFGFTEIQPLSAAADDALLDDLDGPIHLMEFHEDTFSMPNDAVPLMTGKACANQGFRIGRAVYGFQYHQEVDPMIARAWARIPAAVEALGGGDPIDRIETDIVSHAEKAAAFTEAVTDRWMNLARVGINSEEKGSAAA